MKTHSTVRQIDVFDKKTERLIEELKLDSFDLEFFKTKFVARQNDPLMYNPYKIDANNFQLFQNIKFEFDKYDYFLACYSDYSVSTNKKMDKYLLKLGYNFWEYKADLPQDLEKIVNSKFIVDNDCITLKGLGISNNPIFQTDIEKSEWEYNETHFHPDSFSKEKNEMEYLKLALESGKQIAARLSIQFKSKKKFRIIVSYNETITKNGEIDCYGSSKVRLYQIRGESKNTIFPEDLEEYKSDALLLIESI